MQSATVDQILQAALSHHQAGRSAQAELLYRQILAERPDHPDALHLLGVLAGAAGRHDVAVELIGRAIAVNPGAAPYHANLGEYYRQLNKMDEAIAALGRAVALDPSFSAGHNNLGLVLRGLGRLDEAEAAFREAVRLNPASAEAHCNIGQIYQDQGRLDEALTAYRRAIDVDFNYAMGHNNLGATLNSLGQYRDAMAAFAKAIALNPNHAMARMNMGMMQLLLADFDRGWANFEWRWKDDQLLPDRRLPRPRWNGETLNGRNILIYAEQGFGDTLQFVRYLPMVAGRGGEVILECQPRLLRLLRDLSGVTQSVAIGQPLPAFDVHCPLLSLPGIFATTLQSIPATVPYLHAPAQLLEAWKAKVGAAGENLRVGLCWAGRPTHSNDRNRSILLAALSPLSGAGPIEFYSLQKGPAAAQAACPPEGMKLIDFFGDVGDFADAAALVAHLDLVITVDTAMAHLAGALGKPVWVILPLAVDWRWMLDRQDSPWYPTMRLFRQTKLDNRPELIQQVARSLAEWASDRRCQHKT